MTTTAMTSSAPRTAASDRPGGQRAWVSALIDSCGRVGTDLNLFEQAANRLRRIVPFAGSCWFATDPATILASSAVRVENIESGHCESYWEREARVEDAMLYRDLARSAAGAATLCGTTFDQPARSARYREFLVPQGYGAELRAFRLASRV